MPSRGILPKLSIFSLRSSSGSLPSPSVVSPPSVSPSARSVTSSNPISPPARLHLRNILPSTPDALPTPPLPPPKPRPWVWQCHSCLTIYQLGCTRRCLNCSHTYCVSPPPAVSSSKVYTTTGKRRRRKRAPPGTCAAEFDYAGWREWGAWRRKVLGLEAQGRCDEAARRAAFASKRHDCWLDCDSPSQCCHTRRDVAEEIVAQRRASAMAMRRLNRVHSSPTSPTSAEDRLPLNLAFELDADKGEDEQNSPTSPLRQENFFAEPASPLRRGKDNMKKFTWPWSRGNTGGSPVVDARQMSAKTLRGLMDQDTDLMPIDENDEYTDEAAASWSWPRSGPLMVRNVSEAADEIAVDEDEGWEDCDSGSDSGSDDSDSCSSCSDDEHDCFGLEPK
ncbi:hypothetical protein F5Y15DRAFT_160085 [Xylariaceae sp. FL0016]|nr:hypothetical protein F5Y15DRAFT_160085 [Xylariaceae sp. FL0016]